VIAMEHPGAIPAVVVGTLRSKAAVTVPRNEQNKDRHPGWLESAGEIMRTKVLRAVFGAHGLGLADQAVVSGASFLAIVLVGRSTDPSELGYYALAMSLIVSSVTIQDSLISLPYTFQIHHPIGAPVESAGSSLMQSGLLSALCIAVFVTAGLSLAAYGSEPKVVALAWTLAGVVPFALLRQFCRRFAFAHLRTTQALMIDAPAVALQLAGLSWLAYSGWLSSVTACLVLGAACALSAGCWLFLARANFAFRTDQLWPATKQSWNLARWFFATQITILVLGNANYWLLSALTGAVATGIYAACMSTVSLANPLINGLDQVLMPSSVRAFKEGGGAGLWSEVIRASRLLGVATALPCAVIFFAGEQVMRLLYHDPAYEGQGHILIVLALALLASAMGIPASNALATLERPRPIFIAGLLASLVSVILASSFAIEWGIAGAAYGFLAGSLVGAAGRWVSLLKIAPRHELDTAPRSRDLERDFASVTRVIERFIQPAGGCDLTLEPLEAGGQANVFIVRSQSHEPVWQAHETLIVKLYKQEAPVELMREQFEAMSMLDAALAGRTFCSWKIHTPEQLYFSESPPAVVMSMVPGKKLVSLLEMPDSLSLEALDSAARATVAAIKEYWSRANAYGELSFTNILCDPAGRSLSFIDAGMPTESFRCYGVSTDWYPASQDLGYMLFYVTAGLKRDIVNSVGRLRKEMFIESALRAFVQTISRSDERGSALDEIRDCARSHLGKLDQSRSLHGLWCALIRQIARRRIARIIRQVKIDVGAYGRAVQEFRIRSSRSSASGS